MAKNILVVGASSGIGKATAEYLYQLGANVVLIARNETVLREMVKDMPERSTYFSYDLMDLEHIETIFGFCKDNGICLDGMVYCAGINKDLPIKVNRIGTMQEMMQVNYMAFVECAKYFLKAKYSVESSAVVAVSSGITNSYPSGTCLYSSSKAALEAAVKVLAKEAARRKIRANAVLPAFVDTPMYQNTVACFGNEEVAKNQSFGVIEPQAVAEVIEFLLSDKARYITGGLIPISAGAN